MDFDITDHDINSALRKGCTTYLGFLQDTKRASELSRPRHGKGVETASDVSTDQELLSQVAATEVCLQYCGRIAESVRQWMVSDVLGSDIIEDAGDEKESKEGAIVNDVAEIESGNEKENRDERPEKPSFFLDPFSGKMIEERTKFSAGPSKYTTAPKTIKIRLPGTGSNTVRIHSRTPPKVPKKPSAKVRLPGAGSKPGHSGSHTKATKVQDSSVAMLGMSQENSSLDLSSIVVPDVRKEVGYLDDRTMALELQATLDAEHDDGRSQFGRDRTEAIRLAREIERDARKNDADYALRLQRDEDSVAAQWESEIEEAREIASQWDASDEALQREALRFQELQEKENTQLMAQAEFARGILREEEERNARIQEDIIAARAAQELWEAEVRAQEEQKKKDVEEQGKLEAERAREEAAKIAEAANQARLKRHEEKAEAALRKQTETAKKKAATEKEWIARQIDCLVCGEAGDRNDMAVLACKHAYCGECIKAAFEAAMSSRHGFKCCFHVPISTATRWLAKPFVADFELMLLEKSTPNPRYCSESNCSKFIPPKHIHGLICTCPSCGTKTCKSCGNKEHAGICAEDVEGKKLETLAKEKGWKTCGSCHRILEKTEGCLHMTCLCGSQWCYNCSREWKECKSTCQRT